METPLHQYEETSPIESVGEQQVEAVESSKPRSNRFMRMMHTALAATTIAGGFGMGQAEAADSNRNSEENREQRIARITAEREKGFQQYQDWLSELSKAGLTLGKPKEVISSPVQQIGIYTKNGEYLGDVRAEKVGNFSKGEFIEKVTNILKEHSIAYSEMNIEPEKESTQRKELVVENGVMQKVIELGLDLNLYRDAKGKRKLSISANTDSEDKKDDRLLELDVDSDHNPDSYARIYVSDAGVLTIDGKDGTPYKFEFKRDPFADDDGKRIKLIESR